jgi:hypothetical protein
MTCDLEILTTILWYTRISMWGMSAILGYALGKAVYIFVHK